LRANHPSHSALGRFPSRLATGSSARPQPGGARLKDCLGFPGTATLPAQQPRSPGAQLRRISISSSSSARFGGRSRVPSSSSRTAGLIPHRSDQQGGPRPSPTLNQSEPAWFPKKWRVVTDCSPPNQCFSQIVSTDAVGRICCRHLS